MLRNLIRDEAVLLLIACISLAIVLTLPLLVIVVASLVLSGVESPKAPAGDIVANIRKIQNELLKKSGN